MHRLARACLPLIACSCAHVAMAQPVEHHVATPTVYNPNRHAVTGVPAARRLFALAATRRVDIAIIGDSNTRQLMTSGHEEGMARAFGARFGTYASRVDPFAGAGGWGSPTIGLSSTQFPPFGSIDGLEVVRPYVFTGIGLPSSFGYLKPGDSVGTTYNVGLTMTGAHPLGVSNHLRYHLTDMSIDGGGSYAFSVRAPWPGDPYVDFFSYEPTVAPSDGLRDLALDIPAGSRSQSGLVVVPADLARSRASAGPLVGLYHRLERVDQTTGIAYSPMWFRGGKSARTVLEDFGSSAHNVTAMGEWMRQATRLQGAGDGGVLLVHIMHGGNDAQEYRSSLGPTGGLPSYGPDGQRDNTLGIIQWVRGAWVESGRDPANLFFLLGPYHPLDVLLPLRLGYEQGWRDIAAHDPQVIAMAGSMLSTPREFANRGFNQTLTDAAHLSTTGYLEWGRVTVAALSRAVCPADQDQNGTLGVSDIVGYLNAWLSADAAADFDYSGSLDVYDIFEFLTAWFDGC